VLLPIRGPILLILILLTSQTVPWMSGSRHSIHFSEYWLLQNLDTCIQKFNIYSDILKTTYSSNNLLRGVVLGNIILFIICFKTSAANKINCAVVIQRKTESNNVDLSVSAYIKCTETANLQLKDEHATETPMVNPF